MHSTMKWIGAGLSGMACGTMAIQESSGVADWFQDSLPLLQLTSWLLFPGLAFLFLGMIGGGRERASQKKKRLGTQTTVSDHFQSARFTVQFYRAVSQHKEG